MTKTKDNWIKSPWTINIATAIFSLLLTMGYDYLKGKPVLTTISSILKWLGNLVLAILNFNFKVWWIIVIVILFILIIIIIDKFKKEESDKPDFYSYREGSFKRWRWTWSWEWDKNRSAWIISNLQAHCPNCNTPMIDHSSRYGLNFDCPRCDFRASDEKCDEPHKIERIILDNIDRKRNEKKNSQ